LQANILDKGRLYSQQFLLILAACAIGILVALLNEWLHPWASVVLLIALLAITLARLLVTAVDLMSPLVLFGGLYITYYAVGMLPNPTLRWYESYVTTEVLLYGLIGLLCFTGGVMVAYFIFRGYSLRAGGALRLKLHSSLAQLSWGRVLLTITLFAVIGIFFALAIFAVGGGIPFLATGGDQNLARYDAIRRVGYFVHFQLYFLFIAALFAWTISLRHARVRIVAFLLMGATAAFFLVTYNRVELVRLILCAMIVYHYVQKPLGMRAVLAMALSGVLAIGVVHMLRIEAEGGNFLENVQLAFWYMQGSIGFPMRVFERVLEEIPVRYPYLGGHFNFSTYLSLFGQVDSGPELIRQYLYPERITAQTLALPGGWYADGGMAAVATGMFLSGFILQSVYTFFLREATVLSLLVYVNIAFEMIYAIYLGGGALGIRVWLLALLAIVICQAGMGRNHQFAWVLRGLTALAFLTGVAKLLTLLI
jgi:oligosaccharide repeat unit polymerase